MTSNTKTINKSKAVRLFCAVKTTEQKTFMRFLESPYHNTRKDVIALYNFLTTIKSWDKKVSKLVVIDKVFPEHRSSDKKLQAADDSRLRNTMNALGQLIEQFFALEKWKENNTAIDRCLLDSFIERKEFKLAETKVKKATNKLEALPWRNSKYFFNKFQLEEARFYLDIFNRNRKLETRSTNTQEAFLNYAYSIVMLYYGAELNQATVMNIKPESKVPQQLMAIVGENMDSFSELIRLYYFIIRTLEDNDNEAHFEQSKQLFERIQGQLDVHNQRQFYGFLVNYSNRQIRKGKSKYRKVKSELFLQGLQRKVWNAGIYLAAPYYFLHIKNLLEMGNIEQAVEFMAAYKDEINPQFRDPEKPAKNILHLCDANVAFYRKDNDKAFEKLNLFTAKEDTFYFLYVKILLIKLFYEENIIPSLSNGLKSFQVYLNRNETLSAPVRGAYKEFRGIVVQLRGFLEKKFHGHLKRNEVDALVSRISQLPNLVEREWLVAKAKALYRKRKRE